MMKKVLAGVLLSLGAFVVSSLVVTPPAEARKCGKHFKIKRSAGSKVSKNAKKHARRKAWRRARIRCGAGRIALRTTTAWKYKCVRRGKLKRCAAYGTFRCCRTGKLSRKSRKFRSKRSKKRRFARAKRRSKRFKRRTSKRRTSKRRGHCIKKLTLRGRALSNRKAIAKKVARGRVFRNAKLRCKRRFPRYMSRWQYTCKRDGRNFSCTASNIVRCCSGKRITRRSKRRTKRRSKRFKRAKKRPTN